MVKNTGGRALQKGDVDRPLAVTVGAGGSLLLIETIGTPEQVALSNWRFQQDNKWAILEPRLFNPGESIVVCIAYTCVPEHEESTRLTWDIRASGMAEAKVMDLDARWREAQKPGWRAYILFQGSEILVLVGMAVVFSMLGMMVAWRTGAAWFRSRLCFFWVLALTSLSWCTAEIIAWLIYRAEPIAWRYAVPLLALHVLLICILIRFAGRAVAPDREPAGTPPGR